jgi:hypothetical protein
MLKAIKSAVMQKVESEKRRLQPSEVARELARSLGASVKDVKRAMNELVFEGKLEYTYYGQSYIELPLSVMEREPPRLPREKTG